MLGKRIVVIGSEGNIGAPLTAALQAEGHYVVACDIKPGWKEGYFVADINSPLDLLPAFDSEPEVVFMLAAMVSRVTCEQAGSQAALTNLAGLNNIVQLSKRAGAKLVYFSTSEVYGPDCETMDEAETDPRPNNRYGLTKLLGEKLIEYEVANCGLDAVTLRPFMMYDENEDLGDHRSAMIRFATNLALGKPIEVHRGSARGWLHVSDALRAIRSAMHLDRYAVVNIGNPDIRPISDLAEVIADALGADRALIGYREIPGQMTLVKRPSLERQRVLLGVEPVVSLEDGVELVSRRVVERLRWRGLLA